MNRKTFIKTSLLASAGISYANFLPSGKTHILSLSFDDGFKKSFYKIADIHETYGLKACLNVIATGHFKDFTTGSKWMPQKILGNFEDWNNLKERGHEIMPHTWRHLNLTEIPIEQAKENIDKCLDYFEKHLNNYNSKDAVYNFAYNASNKELEDHALKRVLAVRTGGWLVLNGVHENPIPVSRKPTTLGCWSHGPDFCDQYVENEVNTFLSGSGGWLILNLHGLDKEGWGPVRTSYLDNLLKRLTGINHLGVLPTGEVLKKLSS